MERISKIPIDIENILREHTECSVEELLVAESNAVMAENEYEYAISVINSMEQLSDQRSIINNLVESNEELLESNTRMIKTLYDEIGYVSNSDISVESIGTAIGKILITLTKIFKKIFKAFMVIVKKLWSIISKIIKDVYTTINDHIEAEKEINSDENLKSAEENIVNDLNDRTKNGSSNEDGYVGFEYNLDTLNENPKLNTSKVKSIIDNGVNESDMNAIISFNYDFINKHKVIDGNTIKYLKDTYSKRIESIISIIEFSGDMMLEVYDGVVNTTIPDLSEILKKHADGIILRDVNYMRSKKNIDSGSIPVYKSGLSIISVLSNDAVVIKPVQHKIELPVIKVSDLVKEGYYEKIKFMTNSDIVNSGFFKTSGEILDMEKQTLKGISRITDIYSTLVNKELTRDKIISRYEKNGLLEKFNMTEDKYLKMHMEAINHIYKIAIQFSNEYKKLAVEINRIQDNLVPITIK